MRKSLLLCAVMALSLAACGGSSVPSPQVASSDAPAASQQAPGASVLETGLAAAGGAAAGSIIGNMLSRPSTPAVGYGQQPQVINRTIVEKKTVIVNNNTTKVIRPARPVTPSRSFSSPSRRR